MGKRELVKVLKRNRVYKVCADDIRKVYTFIKTKRPRIPAYDSETCEDEIIEIEKVEA